MNQGSGGASFIPFKKRELKSPLAAFAIAAGLLVLLFSCATTRQVSCLLYYLNWHHWPWWYSLNLWVVALGAVLKCFVRRGKLRLILYSLVSFAILCVTAVCSDWLHPLSHRVFCFFKSFYYSVLRPYLYAPVTEFFSAGVISILLFAVLISFFLAGGLVLLRYCRNNSSRKENRKSEGDSHGKK